MLFALLMSKESYGKSQLLCCPDWKRLMVSVAEMSKTVGHS